MLYLQKCQKYKSRAIEFIINNIEEEVDQLDKVTFSIFSKNIGNVFNSMANIRKYCSLGFVNHGDHFFNFLKNPTFIEKISSHHFNTLKKYYDDFLKFNTKDEDYIFYPGYNETWNPIVDEEDVVAWRYDEQMQSVLTMKIVIYVPYPSAKKLWEKVSFYK